MVGADAVAEGRAVLAAGLGLVLLQRLIELDRSRTHTRALLARGGVEHGRGHYPALVLAHVVFYLMWAAEAWWRARSPDAWTVAWLAVFAVAQVARLSILAVLGPRWTTRVVILPRARLVTRGPYRFLRHPNYAVVVIEIVALAGAFRAWWTLVVALVLQAVVLTVRIRCEERALRGATR